MAPHSSTLAWKIPWMEEPGRLQSMWSLRVGHDWATLLSLFTFMHWSRKWQPTPVFLPWESQGRGAWWAAIYGVAQGRTQLKWLSNSSSGSVYISVLLSQFVPPSPSATSLVAQMVKHLPAIRETWVRSLCWEDLLEKEMATHSSILAWRIPRTEEHGRLQSMGSQRVRHDWATSLSLSLLLLLCTKVCSLCLQIGSSVPFF